MTYRTLGNDLTIQITEPEEVNIFCESNITTVVYDIITDGTPVYIHAFNIQREIISRNPSITIPDSETSSPDYSPTSSNLFNQVVIAPNFLRFKTFIAGTVEVRVRGIYG